MRRIPAAPRLTNATVAGLLSLAALGAANGQQSNEKGIIIPTPTVTVGGLFESAALNGVPVDLTIMYGTPVVLHLQTPATQMLLGHPTVTLTVPEFFGDYRHRDWYEGLSYISNENSITVDITTDRSFTAAYVLQRRTLDVNSEPDDGCVISNNDVPFIVTPAGLSYEIHSLTQLSAPAEYNNRPFARWLVDGNQYTTERDLNITMDEDHSAVAEYGTGLVKVYIKPKQARRAGARWRVDGGPWQKHKTIVDDTLVGDVHTIEFKDVDGFVTPKDKTVGVSFNTLTEAMGRYEPAKRR